MTDIHTSEIDTYPEPEPFGWIEWAIVIRHTPLVWPICIAGGASMWAAFFVWVFS